MTIPGIAGIVGFTDATVAGGGPGGGSQRQIIVPGRRPMYVNTTSGADKQYILPIPLYLNEQN